MEQSVKRNTACAKPYGNGRSDGSGHESGRFYTKLQNTYFTDWMSYDVYIKRINCIGIAQVSEQEQTIENAYLKSCQDEKSVLFAGAVYEKSYRRDGYPVNRGVCDLVFRDGALYCNQNKTGYHTGTDVIP